MGLYAQDLHPGGLCVISTPDEGKVYGYVLGAEAPNAGNPPKGLVIAPFWSENGYRLCPFLVWKWVWFSWELWKCLNVFVVSIPDEKERKIICEFKVDFKKSFCWRSNLSNDDIISAYVGLKSGVGLRG